MACSMVKEMKLKKGWGKKGIGHSGEELRTLRITHFQT